MGPPGFFIHRTGFPQRPAPSCCTRNLEEPCTAPGGVMSSGSSAPCSRTPRDGRRAAIALLVWLEVGALAIAHGAGSSPAFGQGDPAWSALPGSTGSSEISYIEGGSHPMRAGFALAVVLDRSRWPVLAWQAIGPD